MSARRLPDHFARRARRAGHPARSIFKLEEIDQRWRLLRPGQRVLDLGAAPGSWLQYAATRVGGGGHVLGIDLKPLPIRLPANASVRCADVLALAPALPGPFDVVLSDMAPATMGDHKTDAARSANLAAAALDIADRLLASGGHVVVKVLEGADTAALVARARGAFGRLELLRPQATRRASTEIFLVGLGRTCAT